MIRRPILSIALVVVVQGALLAQIPAGSWELSLATTAGSMSLKTEYSGSMGSGVNDPEAQSYITLYFRPAYFLADGLSLEPEIVWTAVEDVKPAMSFSGNVSYTYRSPESQVAPFVLVGYGAGNAIPISQRVLGRSSDEFDVSVLHAGAGLKAFLSDAAALRLEYRYQRYHQEETSTFGPYTATYKRTNTQHNIILGFSVFL